MRSSGSTIIFTMSPHLTREAVAGETGAMVIA